MSEFLSDEWVADLDASLRSHEHGSSPEPLVVQYIVTRADESTASYHVELGPDGDRAAIGVAATPDVTFQMGEETARRISAGELSSQEAFLDGLLDLDGDTAALIEAYRSDGNG